MNKYKKIAVALLIIGIAVIVIGGITALVVGGKGKVDPEYIQRYKDSWSLYGKYAPTEYNTEGMQAILIPCLISGAAALLCSCFLGVLSDILDALEHQTIILNRYFDKTKSSELLLAIKEQTKAIREQPACSNETENP